MFYVLDFTTKCNSGIFKDYFRKRSEIKSFSMGVEKKQGRETRLDQKVGATQLYQY